jgi:apolipoprotein N-acyltransferase
VDRSLAIEPNAILSSWLPLILGSIALLFANGRWVIPIAAWLYVLFMIRFLRRQPPLRGFLVLALVEMVANTLAWWGTTSASFGPLQFVPAGMGILIALAFLLDRLLAPRLGGMLATLVFPVAYTLLEWLITLLSPLGSIGILAYTQYDNLPLIQVVSLTGTAGLTFLIAWFGSVANFAWEQGFSWPAIRQAGRNGTDILLAPSFDWYEIDPFHTRYAVLRAVENGSSLVRQVAAGLSIATDPYGRALASMDAFTANEQAMVAQVPAHGVRTLYAYAGDWFNGLVALGFAVLLCQGLRRMA